MYTIVLQVYTMQQTVETFDHAECGRHACNLNQTRVDVEVPMIILMKEIVAMSNLLSDEFIYFPNDNTIIRCNEITIVELNKVTDQQRASALRNNISIFNSYKFLVCSLAARLLSKKVSNNIRILYSGRFDNLISEINRTANLNEFKYTCQRFIEYLDSSKYYN